MAYTDRLIVVGISLSWALVAATDARAWTMDTPLATSDASFLGEMSSAYAGYSVGGAGDVDGDGLEDLVIGACQDSEVDHLAGKAYLVLGSAGGWTMDTPFTSAAASFLGEAYSDQAGFSVAGAGDVDGDGYDDLLIGARGNDEAATSAGQMYLVFGGAGGWYLGIPLSSVDASFQGEAADDMAGFAVAAAGDVDGDGYDDILLSGHGSDEAATDAGQAYVFLGGPAGWAMDLSLADADASFHGEAAGDYAGIALAGAGDVNGDGHDDVLVGAAYNDEAGADGGQVYLLLGDASGWAADTPLAAADASFLGEAADDHAGDSVAGAGDADGDGYADILVGARGNDDAAADAGKVYLLFGDPGGWSMDSGLAAADASFVGETSGDLIGRTVAGGGDVDADGYDDFIVGTWSNDEVDSQAGQAYLVLGASAGWSQGVSLSAADASFLGEAGLDWAGFSVAVTGDVDGDGAGEILIGAPYRSEPHSHAGQAYLILGEPIPGDDDDSVGDDDDSVGDDDDSAAGDDDDSAPTDDDDSAAGDDDDSAPTDDDDSAAGDDDDDSATDDDDDATADDDDATADDDDVVADDDVVDDDAGDCECSAAPARRDSGIALALLGLLLIMRKTRQR